MTFYLAALLMLVTTAVHSQVVPAVTAESSRHNSSHNLSELRFVVYHPQFPPYIFTEPLKNRVKGIIPEIMAPFFAAEGIKVEYLFDNRAGAEQRLYKGEVDAMMLSEDWAMQPEWLLFSASIMPYYDYLFAASSKEVVILPEQLRGKKICTRQYYVYPELQSRFKRGQLLRLDSSSHEAQMRMLLNQRCDLMYMNNLVAQWLLQHSFADKQLFRADIADGKAELKIALHPKWLPLLTPLNHFIQQQQQNGELQRIIDKYVR